MATRKSDSIASLSIEEFIEAVSRLQPDQPYHRRGGTWYGTTRDQWLGWLSEYDSAGFYGRQGRGDDARFAYNHVQNHQMLVWLIAAAGVDAPTLARAAAAGEAGKSMAGKAAAVRKIVPWEHVAELLGPEVRGQQRDRDRVVRSRSREHATPTIANRSLYRQPLVPRFDDVYPTLSSRHEVT